MKIGKPKRIYRVEPLRDPVPSKEPREEPAAPERRLPETTPTR